jgi:hypothetical protein
MRKITGTLNRVMYIYDNISLDSCQNAKCSRKICKENQTYKENRTRYSLGTRLGEAQNQSGLFRDEFSCPSQKLNHDSSVLQLAAKSGKPVKLTHPAGLMFVGLISLTALRQAYKLPTFLSRVCLSVSLHLST